MSFGKAVSIVAVVLSLSAGAAGLAYTGFVPRLARSFAAPSALGAEAKRGSGPAMARPEGKGGTGGEGMAAAGLLRVLAYGGVLAATAVLSSLADSGASALARRQRRREREGAPGSARN